MPELEGYTIPTEIYMSAACKETSCDCRMCMKQSQASKVLLVVVTLQVAVTGVCLPTCCLHDSAYAVHEPQDRTADPACPNKHSSLASFNLHISMGYCLQQVSALWDLQVHKSLRISSNAKGRCTLTSTSSSAWSSLL